MVGDVRIGLDQEEATADRLGTPGFPAAMARGVSWGRVALEAEHESVEGPLAHPLMEFDDVVALVEVFLGHVEDWFCETKAGWGNDARLSTPPGLTRDAWRRAVARVRTSPEG